MCRFSLLFILFDYPLLCLELNLNNILAYDIIEHPIPSKHVPSNINFSALGRWVIFTLFIIIFFRNFKIKLNQPSNTVRETKINLLCNGEITRQQKLVIPEEINGLLEDEAPSKVNILIGSRGEFYATIKTQQEVYIFEVFYFINFWFLSPYHTFLNLLAAEKF